jgi:signal peptidase II
MNPRDLGLAVAAGALVLDQVSKLLLLFAFGFIDMVPGETIHVLPFFNLVMVWNPGVSYGLFPASGPLGTAVLVVFQVIAVAGLGWWMWDSDRRSLTIGQGLVIGGALGNVIDRLIYGKVADFFHFYAFGYSWYVFNIADVAITFGAMALMYDVLKPEPQAKKDA